MTANFGTQLQYRLPDGSWSEPQDNALLVPDTPGIDEVRVTRGGTSETINLG